MNKPLCIALSSIVPSDSPDDIAASRCMIYDPRDGLNKIKDGDNLVPAIIADEHLGTTTFTKANNEHSDTDYQDKYSIFLSTRTYTEAQLESTDEDPSPFNHHNIEQGQCEEHDN